MPSRTSYLPVLISGLQSKAGQSGLAQSAAAQRAQVRSWLGCGAAGFVGHRLPNSLKFVVFLISVQLVAMVAGPQSRLLASEDQAPAKVEFLRDIQPILAEHCLHCHGVDTQTRLGGLRLDLREAALTGGESGQPAIVPGKPDASELLNRIYSHDESTVMPPPREKKPLSDRQKSLLSQWIQEGAAYETHWAFTNPQKSELPGATNSHPIDAFVEARLRREGLTMSPQADDVALCRRLYLDITGLPPSPAELQAFKSDGFDATAEKLLASERYGEKWARHWLDVARYSDTNGYEKDLQREQWSWRDWVIRAINNDMPYDQFLIEQLAGDLLPSPTQDQIIATGFLRNSMINEEGAIVPEQFRMVEMFDRMDCIGKAVLGLSTQCAQCHSHKFDPIAHSEYYGMFAFLNNSYEAQSWVYTNDQIKQIADIRSQISQTEAEILAVHPTAAQDQVTWAESIAAGLIPWETLTAIELGSISGLNHPTQESDGSLLMRGHTSSDIFMIAQPSLKGATGIRLETLPHLDLPFGGPGRSGTGTWGIVAMEAFIRKPDGKDWEKLKLINATADYSNPDQKQPDGKKASGPVSYLIDDTDETTWTSDRGIGRRNQASVAVVQFETPLDYPEGTQLKIALRMTDMLGCGRLSITRAPAPTAPEVNHAAILAIQKPESERTPSDMGAIADAWRRTVEPLKPQADKIDGLLASLPQAPTSILHMKERSDGYERTTYLLDRGNWDQPKDPIIPHVPTAFHSWPEGAPVNRLGFAMWLTDKRSPLTARVAVNRVWQSLFGEGLVETAEDFGTRSSMPEYRELLDWLAVDYMEHGWSQKHLIRTIVRSDVWKQSSRATPELIERDPRNRLLARGAKFRVDAEVVRDIALSAAGLMTHKVGGPGVIPPVPQNVLDYNYVYPSYWKPAEGPERYRRAVYGFRKRSMPDPVMTSFDAPNGDFSCARRIRSNTPLAALAGLNETIFVEAARGLSLRVLRESELDDSKRADYAFQLCTSRIPNDEERQEVLNLLTSQRQRIADGWLNPREITTGDPARLPELPEGVTPQDAAAWTLVSRILLNLDETISRN